MKITDVEAIILRQPSVNRDIADGSQDDLVVRITTDEGIVGVGEVDSAPEAVAALVNQQGSHAIAGSLRDQLIGENPSDVERLWWKLYRALIYIGRRGIALHALSGVDIALWDIAGKTAGVPVHRLLGETRRTSVRAYASRLMPDTVAETREAVAAARDQGFTAVKLGWGPLGADAAHDVELAAAAKEAAGDADVLIDAGLGYRGDLETATWVARQFEQIGIYWLEEPFDPDEYELYAELADTVDLRIAGGEQETTVWGFRELIERGHVDVIQPDVIRCGGVTEWLRIARLGQEHGLETVPHAWKSGIVKAASLQCVAVIPEATFQEYCVANTPINETLTRERFPIVDGGFVRIPTEPGVGATLDDEVIARYRIN